MASATRFIHGVLNCALGLALGILLQVMQFAVLINNLLGAALFHLDQALGQKHRLRLFTGHQFTYLLGARVDEQDGCGASLPSACASVRGRSPS